MNPTTMSRILGLLFWAALLLEFPWQLRAAQFTLTWSDNSTNELAFKIERAPGLNATSGFVQIAEVGANVTSYVDAGLPNSTPYSYRLRAWNTAGHSGYSNTASGTTPPPEETVPATPGTLELTWQQKLVNLSTRIPPTDTSTEPVIAGFVLAQPATVLLRGVGPALAQFGVPQPLDDPRIALVRQSDGAQLVANDDWSGADVAAAAAKVGAFALTAGSRDAALLVTLPAGSYTVHLSGAAGSIGTALIEVYLVP